MTQSLTSGDSVRLSDREQSAADIKSGLFYPHYRGLIGTVAKIYQDGTAAVTIDPVSLPDALRTRHQAGSEAQRRKWLDGLSDEARNRLSAAEKQFSLRYTILVAASDLSRLNRKSSADLEDAEKQYLETRRHKD